MATIVDSYSESNKDTQSTVSKVHPSSEIYVSAFGQSFTGDGKRLVSCKFYIKRTLGTPGNLIARLYAHSGTFGTSSVPTGTALDSSNLVAASSISDSIFELVTFVGFSGYTLANGTHYCIVFEAYDGTWDTNNYVQGGRDGSSPTHAGNYCYWRESGWNAHASDACFYVYGSALPSPVADGDLIGIGVIRKT